ncbi:hypothetical protein PTKIN_Ptkin05aG0030400 [Pterospermum kingtungense]
MRDSSGSKKKNDGNKDSRHRKIKDEFRDQVGSLISKILGDRDFEKRNWKNKIELVKEAKEKLNCPEFVLKWCGQLMENKSSSSDINKAGSEDKAYEIPESSHDNILRNQKGGLQIKAWQELKEQTRLYGEEIGQIKYTSEHIHQSVREQRDLLAGNGDIFSELEGQMNLSVPQDVTVQNFQVFPWNAEALNEILNEYPETAINFKLNDPDNRNYFMNSLAWSYRNITQNNPKTLEEIDKMNVMVQDMEKVGLQLPWLAEKLRKDRESQENEVKKCQEIIDNSKIKAKEAEVQEKEAKLKMERILKKPRIQ